MAQCIEFELRWKRNSLTFFIAKSMFGYFFHEWLHKYPFSTSTQTYKRGYCLNEFVTGSVVHVHAAHTCMVSLLTLIDRHPNWKMFYPLVAKTLGKGNQWLAAPHPHPKRHPHSHPIFFTRGQFWSSGSVFAFVCLYVCVSVCVRVRTNHLLVCVITQDPFKLGSPRLVCNDAKHLG